MKKLIVLAGAIALVAAACNTTPPNNEVVNNPPPPPPAAATQVYTSPTHGFNFTYPSSMQLTSANYALLKNRIVQMQIKQTEYPETNFEGAAFTVSSDSARTLSDCLKINPPQNSDGFTTKVTINGIEFFMSPYSGAAAGNFYQGKVYRAHKASTGTCFEVIQTVHTSNYGNYPAGTVTQIDILPIQAKLDTILNTFKFN